MSMDDPSDSMYAVRRNWPDGSHDYFRLSTTSAEAKGGITRDQRYWRGRGPHAPTSWKVVTTTANGFEIHRGRDRCRHPNCP